MRVFRERWPEALSRGSGRKPNFVAVQNLSQNWAIVSTAAVCQPRLFPFPRSNRLNSSPASLLEQSCNV